MNSKDQKVSDYVSKAYKDLPLEMRVRVNMTASELLEIQRKNKVLVEDGGDLSSYEDGGNLGRVGKE
ncbi:hypothetical protein R84B8_02359 [Treponema sp. R8-4-B8]